MDRDVVLQRLRRALHPPERDPYQPKDGDKRAAVAAILRPRQQELDVLLIKRAAHPDDPWSGHMAFPGGRCEPDDLHPIATAVRETQEEVGLDLVRHGELVGALPEVPAIGRGQPIPLTIAPRVFLVEPELPPLSPNHEVDAIVWAALGPMVRGENRTSKSYTHRGTPLELPAHDVHGHIVWGLTYRMLELLFEALEPGDEPDRDPDTARS